MNQTGKVNGQSSLKSQKSNFAFTHLTLQKVSTLNELLDEVDSKLNQTMDTPRNQINLISKNSDYGYGSAQDSLNNSPTLVQHVSTPQEGNMHANTNLYGRLERKKKNEIKDFTARQKFANKSYQQKSATNLTYRALSSKNANKINKVGFYASITLFTGSLKL